MKPQLVIIGLGNPGASYEKTRHNIGFQAVDALKDVFGEGKWKDSQKFSGVVCEGRIGVMPIFLMKPTTYMNLSGQAAKKIVDFYKLDPRTQIIVICDDIDIPLGEVRLRKTGGPGTHNGLKSLVDIFGEEFTRIRIGLGSQPGGQDLSAWVLSVPPEDDRKMLAEAISGIEGVVRELIE